MSVFDRPSFYPHTWTGDPWNRYQKWRDRMFGGERVIAQDGEVVGTVQEIHDDGFRLMGPPAGDIFLPYAAIKGVHDGQIQLNLPFDQLSRTAPRANVRSSSQPVGRHVGHGPRNYVRSDERIYDDVSHRLWADGHLDASGITVAVHEGVVTLDGAVDSRPAKRVAEDLAWEVAGVIDVMNNLRPTGTGGNRWRSQLFPGMDIVGSLGKKIGTIGETREGQFLAERSGGPALWIPYNAIQDVRNRRVILNVRSDEIDNQGWPTNKSEPA